MPLPYGAIVAFAGPVPDTFAFASDGWYLCDGTQLDPGTYAQLSRAIGVIFGGDGAGTFNLPDLRGMFLRGLDNNTGRDGDVGTRYKQDLPHFVPPGPIGTWQDNAWGAHVHHLTGALLVARNEGCDQQCKSTDPKTGGDAGYTDSTSSSAAETRPKNVAVNWLIRGDAKAESGLAEDDPVGTVVAVAIPTIDVLNAEASGWLLCDGRELPVDGNKVLHDKIGAAYGDTDGTDKFFIPDFRGMFQRGQDRQQGRDPESAYRYMQGNSVHVVGDVVGSWQGDQLVSHSHTLTGTWGNGDGEEVLCNSGDSQNGADSGYTDPNGAGDTRPNNVAVNFVIFSGKLQDRRR